MSDIKIGPEGGRGGRGPRGERGERGERGHRGHDGSTGSAGPTGPTGASSAGAWLPIVTVVNPTTGGDFPVFAGFFNLVDPTSDDGNALLPAANSVPNGTPLAIGNFPGHNGATVVVVDLALQPGDSVNGQTASPTPAFELSGVAAFLLLVSDGVSNWQPLSYRGS